mmetsp:Transcript_41582/g.70181  ORF Transcript_41582/g.70181 Transcript_41582/m.70181 type:complete len:260 (-) Transcript_41582:2212-2991(-)
MVPVGFQMYSSVPREPGGHRYVAVTLSEAVFPVPTTAVGAVPTSGLGHSNSDTGRLQVGIKKSLATCTVRFVLSIWEAVKARDVLLVTCAVSYFASGAVSKDTDMVLLVLVGTSTLANPVRQHAQSTNPSALGTAVAISVSANCTTLNCVAEYLEGSCIFTEWTTDGGGPLLELRICASLAPSPTAKYDFTEMRPFCPLLSANTHVCDVPTSPYFSVSNVSVPSSCIVKYSALLGLPSVFSFSPRDEASYVASQMVVLV